MIGRAPTPAQARKVLEYYDEHGSDRGLPWREESCSPDLRAMVEGLLVRTRAEAVAKYWPQLLGDLEGAVDWLELPFAERLNRAGLLGMGRVKRLLVDTIARDILEARERRVIPGKYHDGDDGYCRGVLRLLFGMPGAVVELDFDRIAGRYGCEPGHLSHAVTSGAMNPDEAGCPPSWPPAATYRAFAGLLDIGAVLCTSNRFAGARCGECPLEDGCARRARQLAAASEPRCGRNVKQ
jgi:hypothetical protein